MIPLRSLTMWPAQRALLTIVAANLIAFGALCAAGDLSFTTTNGEKIENVRVSRVEPDGLVLLGEAGIIKVPFAKLPESVQKEYGYDPSKVADFKAEQARIQAAALKSAEAAKAIGDERERADKAQMEAEKQAKREAAEIERKSANAKRIQGKVFQTTNAGLLVNANVSVDSSPSYGIQSIGGGGGSKKTSSTQSAPQRPQSASYGSCLLVGHPMQSSLADNSIVDVDAYEDGLYTYVDTAGAQRRVAKYIVVRVFR